MGITGTSFFTSEQILGEIGGYNEFLEGEIDHIGCDWQSGTKSLFRLLVS